MRFFAFVCVVLISGALAGAVQGAVNLVLVEPVLDRAISLENRELFESGDAVDNEQFRIEYEAYRSWQKSGQILASVILGMSLGSLFGFMFLYGRAHLPGRRMLAKALALAGVMWLVLFMVPFVKYPPNPPTVGDPETVNERTVSYLGLIAVSGFLILGFFCLSPRLGIRARLATAAIFACAIASAVFFFPANLDEANISEVLLYDFRITSAISTTIFWTVLPIIFGTVAERLELPGKDVV